MEKQRGPDPDYVTDDLKLDHGWEETERIDAERGRQAARKPKVQRFSTAKDVEAFEAACGKTYEGNEAAWNTAMDAVKLPLCYQPAVREALSQHRWRNSNNPVGYVKSVAKRIGLKSGANTPDWHGKSPGEACTTSSLRSVLRQEQGQNRVKGVTLKDFIDNTTYQNGGDGYDPDENYLETKKDELLELGLLDRKLNIDLREIGKRARLSREEVRVLGLKMKGWGRDAALASAKTESGRKRLQCVWREFERDRKGPEILMAIRGVMTGQSVSQGTLRPNGRQNEFTPPRKALETALKRQLTPPVRNTDDIWIAKYCNFK